MDAGADRSLVIYMESNSRTVLFNVSTGTAFEHGSPFTSMLLRLRQYDAIIVIDCEVRMIGKSMV